MRSTDQLAAGIHKLGLEVTKEQQQTLLEYVALLQKWNKTYNLTAVREPGQMITHHILDSLAVIPHLWPGRWLDVGCGPGLPGLVIAIVRPEWNVELIDSNSKKTSFVQQAAIELKLNNTVVHCGRVEKWYVSQKYDGIISRAFSELSQFVGLTRHLINKHGGWVAMKGVLERENKPLPEGVEIEKTVSLSVPGIEDTARSLIVLRENHEQDTCNH